MKVLIRSIFLAVCSLCASLATAQNALTPYNQHLPAQAVVGSTPQRQAAYNSLTPQQRQAINAKVQPYMQAGFVQALLQHQSTISNQDLLVHAPGLDGATNHGVSAALGLTNQVTVAGSTGTNYSVALYPTAQSAFPANPLSGQETGADLDHDGLPDTFENQLAASFTPSYHVSASEPDNFATFLNSVPETVSQRLGPNPFSYFRVEPLTFAANSNGVEYGFIRIDYLTLWDHDSGLAVSGTCDAFMGVAGGILGIDLINLVGILSGHDLDDEHSAVLVAAPTINGAFNLDFTQYVAVSYFTAAHEGTVFDHSVFSNPATPVPANAHILLGLSLNKHSTYTFNPDGLPLFPDEVIGAYYTIITALYDEGIICDFEYEYLLYVGDTVFYECVIEHFNEQGGTFASSQVNVGEPAAGSTLNNAGFILDANHVLPKLTETLWQGTVPPIIVNVNPAASALDANQTQQFQAAVSNAPNNNQGVSWSISPAVGSMSPAGFYTAPTLVTAAQTVTITACSTSDSSRCGTASAFLNPIAVGVSPKTATLSPSQTQQFTASVTHTPSSAVTWSINPQLGTINAAGLYTAPPTITSQQGVTLTVCSAVDTSKCDTANITLLPPQDFSLTLNPPISGLNNPNAFPQYTATLAPINGFTGTLNCTVAGLPAGGTATCSAVTITSSSGAVTVGLGFGSTFGGAHTVAATLTITYAGTGNLPSHSASVQISFPAKPGGTD
jgi:hypothetical protein